MTRYQTKYSKLVFGWETAFRQISTTYDNPVVSTDEMAFTINTVDQDLSDGKPKMERTQKHYLNKSSRLPTGTYEGEFKNGSLSLTGDLKYAHLINAVMGTMAAANNVSSTGYFVHNMYIGDRPSMFAYYVTGNSATGTDNHIRNILGCKCDDLSIEGKEGTEVTFDATLLTAKEVACSTNYTIPAAVDVASTRVPYFHFKHAAVNLQIGGTTYTSSTQNHVERFKVSFKNNGAFKHGAPASGGQTHANYDKEGAFEPEIELDIYPEDTLLWRLSPAENMYADTYASSSIALTITLRRYAGSATDQIVFTFSDLEVNSVSEKIAEITDNIVPATVVLKPATYTSTISCAVNDNISTTYYKSA